jgi:phytoene dehydrogenase-like protein
MSPPADWDAVVVGGGHNGLVAAFYLGRAGLRTLVLEKNAVVGGAAVSEEFHPGYRNSVASYVVSLLRPEIVADMRLHDHGYRTRRIAGSFYPRPDGRAILLTGDERADAAQLGAFDARGAAQFAEFHALVRAIGPLVADQWLREPPRLSGGGIADLLAAIRVGCAARGLDARQRHRLAQFLLGSARALIERYVDHPDLRAILGASALSGNYASLHQPGSALPLLHHALGALDGRAGAWGIAIGGMGAITQAMARAAQGQGVQIRTQAPVRRILAAGGRVAGVELEDGERVAARRVLANTDPKRTFLGLLGAEQLPAEFAADVRMIRQESASLRINLALRGLPDFAARPGTAQGPQHEGFICFIESLDSIEASFREARAGRFASSPMVEALIPSTLDDTLAAPGHHVMSLLCKYFPYDLADARGWDGLREAAADHVLAVLRRYVTNLDEIVVARQVLTPLDIERRFGMTRGDILHGRLEPDQLFSMRPHPDAAQYATPLAGLYLCGSGSHPGGGVTGAPGYNAARRVLKDRRSS